MHLKEEMLTGGDDEAYEAYVTKAVIIVVPLHLSGKGQVFLTSETF